MKPDKAHKLYLILVVFFFIITGMLLYYSMSISYKDPLSARNILKKYQFESLPIITDSIDRTGIISWHVFRNQMKIIMTTDLSSFRGIWVGDNANLTIQDKSFAGYFSIDNQPWGNELYYRSDHLGKLDEKLNPIPYFYTDYIYFEGDTNQFYTLNAVLEITIAKSTNSGSFINEKKIINQDYSLFFVSEYLYNSLLKSSEQIKSFENKKSSLKDMKYGLIFFMSIFLVFILLLSFLRKPYRKIDELGGILILIIGSFIGYLIFLYTT